MIAKDLIKILEKRPNAEVLIIAGKEKRTYVADEGVIHMAHTVFIRAENTPYEHNKALVKPKDNKD